MFRECYFEYAGQSSQPYNLMLCYVSNSNTDFDSGGKFDTKTDTLPRSHETLLYGKDYSAQPLEFEVELLNLESDIPLKQMIEIKNWLFEQDGWKTFRCLDDRQEYRLKCIFEPGEDIVDGTKYRGLRCTLKSVSPFWYGEEKEIISKTKFFSDDETQDQTVASGWHCFEVNIPLNNAVDCVIHPKIIATINRAADYGDNNYTPTYGQYYDNLNVDFRIHNSTAKTVSEALEYTTVQQQNVFTKAATSQVHIGARLGDSEEVQYRCSKTGGTYYINVDGKSINTELSTLSLDDIKRILSQNGYCFIRYQANIYKGIAIESRDTYSIDTKNMVITSELVPNVYIPPTVSNNTYDQHPFFNLHYGNNILRVWFPRILEKLVMTYTPVYRMGAF